MRWFWNVATAALVMGALVALILEGCSGCSTPPAVKTGFCKLVDAGLTYVNGQLENPAPVDDAATQEAYQVAVVTPLQSLVTAQSILDTAKEYWDSIPTETKLKAAQDALNYMKANYCAATASQVQSKARDEFVAKGVLAILQRAARPR